MVTKYGTFIVIWLSTVPLIARSYNCTCPQNTIDVENSQDQKLMKTETLEQVTEKKRKRCCPYNFDGKMCRAVGDRILCGYNRNVGRPETNDGDLDLKNGCRIRKGRLECGYDQPPFLNSRRPPVWDYAALEDQIKKNIDNEELSKEEMNQKLYFKSTVVPYLSTRCVEIKDRIVCRQM